MAEKKLTKEELKKLVKLREDISNLYIQVGQIHFQKVEALKSFKVKEDEFQVEQEKLKEREIELYTKIGKKYGKGNIDLESGLFTPIIEENEKI